MSASDHLDSSSYDHAAADDATPVVDRKIVDGDGGADLMPQQEPSTKNIKRTQRRKKEKKRPRDKLLRDPQVGRTVLELRKKGKM